MTSTRSDAPAPSPPPSPSSFDHSPEQGGSGEAYWKVMDSITRIALAGFGGALAGLSISRRRSLGLTSSENVAASVSRTIRRAGGRRRRAQQAQQQAPVQQAATPYTDQDLPSTWAVACLTFAGIVEFSRLVSPTALLKDLADRATSDVTQDEDTQKGQVQADRLSSRIAKEMPFDLADYASAEHIRTISDYVIGGSIAGAVFKGGSIKTSAGEKIARRAAAVRSRPVTTAATAARTGLTVGLIPGAALGFVAGLLHVGVSNLEDLLLQVASDDDEGTAITQSDSDTDNGQEGGEPSR
mmetsp:Transcript_33020/g.72418  ORF Transcript_33020/g.72418 Transcript_33020/m.72418 type:complete len:298 (+) Transcript_33020:120-1013(+)|eukprot:CAMPEP_0178507264 /NCGR_PEP_ID=MMETSP0696-20121128/20126_1 /TAXON_ID=265572 /ORGANISM="Extubocellulus spinifer, Strain CCMP396" /LENGTH=297 /DNA_ID=CAMNT_0020136739 /DNA_START=61 /DNA_END=954 /DNA_ORIENTATION=+